MRAEDLNHRLVDRPFEPFRMHLSDGTTLEVREPGMIIVSPSSAIVPTRFWRDDRGRPLVLDWQTIVLAHIVRFTDIRQRANGRRRVK